jgi:dTDP-4-dehydrorhamnose reductase
MLRLALSHHEVRVVADQWGAPTSAVDLAQFIQSVALSHDDMQHKYGTYHFSNEGQTHWAALAEHVFDIAKRQGKPFADVRHISTQDYPTRAKRPAHSLLDLQLTKRIFGVDIRPWQDAVTDIVTQLCATTGSVT